jgi:hypothetical protein
MLFVPLAADAGVELGFVGAHLADQGFVLGFFVARGPEDHLGKNRGEVYSFWRQGVEKFTAVGGILFGRDNAKVFEAAKAFGKNIGRDFLFGLKKLVESAVTAEHHVAQDEQRPAVAEHFDRGIQRTAGTPPHLSPFFRHFVTVAQCRLQDASEMGRLSGRNTLGPIPSGRVKLQPQSCGEAL